MRSKSDMDTAAVEAALRELAWLPAGVHVATRFDERLLGFITRPPVMLNGLPNVLVFPRCASVHTCFMRAPLDIAFADGRGRVLARYEGVGPWRVRSRPGAAFALERPAVRTPYGTRPISP